MENKIGITLKLLREKLKLSKVKLAKLAKVGVKTIYKLETNRGCSIINIVKIRNALKKNFNIDLYELSGSKFVWDIEDIDEKSLAIIEGSLLGDGCISQNGIYTQFAKDKKFLEWLAKVFSEIGLCCNVVPVRSRTSFSSSNAYELYSHTCPALLLLRRKWYKRNEEKIVKRIPKDIKISGTTLLYWYLGDGNFQRSRRKEVQKRGRPYIRLYTNDFLREDVELLIEKLKQIGLRFNTNPKLNKKMKKGYILRLGPDDVLKFFKLVGFKPIEEIKNCVTETRNGRIYTFKEKWPTKEDWAKILAKTEGIGRILKERRKELGFTQKELAEKLGIKKHQISEIECGRKFTHFKRFKKFLEVLKMDIDNILSKL